MLITPETKIAIIGLGYVGLPLAVEFGKTRTVIGYDINHQRVNDLKAGIDTTKELSSRKLAKAKHLTYTTNIADLQGCSVFIIAVPTPVKEYNCPDLAPLLVASERVGSILTPNSIVIYESTVYPGVTEDECVPLLEQASGLRYNHDFFVGYSPERVMPGVKSRGVTRIKKIVAGSTPEATDEIDALYNEIIAAGTYRAESIRVAEAAKLIENVQRDVNIALTNELAIIFNKMGLDTEAVLQAAESKWNFHYYRPGLVGGHCIGVDPYYLIHKAREIGHSPAVILAGRLINNTMGSYVAHQLTRTMSHKGITLRDSRILIMGFTFKENCADTRNTLVVDIINSLKEYGCRVDVYDPWVDANAVQQEYGFTPITEPQAETYDGVVLAVAHDQFREMGTGHIRSLGRPVHVLYDLKYLLPVTDSDLRL